MGACLVGGHTVDDEEPKYGLCVNGMVHPDRVITNAGAQPGDALILTKSLGSGVLFNAVRSGKLPFKEIEQNVLPELGFLNGLAILHIVASTTECQHNLARRDLIEGKTPCDEGNRLYLLNLRRLIPSFQ